MAIAYELNGRFASHLSDARPLVHWFPEHYRRHLILNVVICASKMLGSTSRQINEAIGLGWMFTPPNMNFIYLAARQRWPRSEHNLWTCQLGVQAALWAKLGLGGPIDLLDDQGGEIYRLEQLTRSPTPFHYVMNELCLKPWINSYGTMGGIQAALDIVRDNALDPGKIRSLVFRGSRTYADPESLFVVPVPRNSVEACASIPWSIANAVLGYEAGPDWLIESGFSDPRRSALARRVHVEVSEHPKVNEMDVVMEDGRSFTKRIERKDYLGSPSNPMTREQVEGKFLRNASPMIGEARAAELVAAFDRLELLPGVSAVTSLYGPNT